MLSTKLWNWRGDRPCNKSGGKWSCTTIQSNYFEPNSLTSLSNFSCKIDTPIHHLYHRTVTVNMKSKTEKKKERDYWCRNPGLWWKGLRVWGFRGLSLSEWFFQHPAIEIWENDSLSIQILIIEMKVFLLTGGPVTSKHFPGPAMIEKNNNNWAF